MVSPNSERLEISKIRNEAFHLLRDFKKRAGYDRTWWQEVPDFEKIPFDELESDGSIKPQPRLDD